MYVPLQPVSTIPKTGRLNVHFRMENKYELVFTGLKVDIADFPVLKGVCGHARQGRVLAIMGPSGCGKTTLLNTLYDQYKVKEGEIRLGNVALRSDQLHRISYVTQVDLFFGDLTLGETLHFYARLKVPQSVKACDLKQKVETLVDLLELRSCLDTQFGDVTQPKLSSGERKRASIACELLGDPRVLLLDEPTTGLDATVALKIMTALNEYAGEFRATVVCSIHQPSSKIMRTFDDILLMYAGKKAYQGTVDDALRRLPSVGLHCGAMQNPADFFLDILSQEDSAELLASIQPQTTGVEHPQKVPEDALSLDRWEGRKWNTGFSRQYVTLLERSLKQTIRWLIHPFQLAECFLLGVLIGCLYYQVPRTEAYLRSREGCLIMLVLRNGFRILAATLDFYPKQMDVVARERFVGLYRLSAYMLATLTTDFLLCGPLPILQATIVYWMAGLWADVSTFLSVLAVLVLQNLTAQSILMPALIILGRVGGSAFGNTAFNFFVVTSGFINLHFRFWASWMKYFGLFYYSYGALVHLEISRGPDVACRPGNVSSFAVCHNSQVTSFQGKAYVESLSLLLPVWLDVVIMLAAAVLFRLAAYFILRYSKHSDGGYYR